MPAEMPSTPRLKESNAYHEGHRNTVSFVALRHDYLPSTITMPNQVPASNRERLAQLFDGAVWRERFHLPWWKRLAKFGLRWTWRLVGTAIIVSALLVLASQTETFRSMARNVVLDQLNQVLRGDIVVDDVRIDVFRGIVLVHPRVSARGKTVFEAEEVALFFDLAPIANGIIAVSKTDEQTSAVPPGVYQWDLVLDTPTGGVIYIAGGTIKFRQIASRS